MAPTAIVIPHYHHHLLFITIPASFTEFPPFSPLPLPLQSLPRVSPLLLPPSLQLTLQMGFFAEDSGLIVTHLLYKAALVLALLRCALSWALKFWPTAAPPPSRRRPSPQQIRDRLILTTFADVLERRRRDQDETAASCAVCLNQMNPEDEVRELRNCCHVFHSDCIHRWIDHEVDDDQEEEGDESNHRTCPLCRTPLLTAAQSAAWSAAAEQQQQPSWAVERILYLFGDDLLVS